MKRRKRPDPEAIKRVQEDAERIRVEAGLPATEQSDIDYEAERAALKQKKAP